MQGGNQRDRIWGRGVRKKDNLRKILHLAVPNHKTLLELFYSQIYCLIVMRMKIIDFESRRRKAMAWGGGGEGGREIETDSTLHSSQQ